MFRSRHPELYRLINGDLRGRSWTPPGWKQNGEMTLILKLRRCAA
jgi:hypothetical protein